MGDLFLGYCSEHTEKGQPLMNCPDLKAFLTDFKSVFPKVKMPKETKIVKVYGDEKQTQMDLCRMFDLTRYEASKGLCFETFRAMLTGSMRSFWHQTMAEEAFSMA